MTERELGKDELKRDLPNKSSPIKIPVSASKGEI